MKSRQLSVIAGISYIIIFFSAIFANFFALESIIKDPIIAIQQDHMVVRWGILAFLVTVVFDIVVAWALYYLYKAHPLSGLSAMFRMTHAIIMGVAIFSLQMTLSLSTKSEILNQVDIFNMIWLIGLFFFGIHLILLGTIVKVPTLIIFFLMVAGVMYMVDTVAHFMLPDYKSYASIFLMLVAVPSIFGEMAFAIWLLAKGGK